MKIEEAIQQKKFKSEHHKATVNLMYTASWINSQHKDFFKPYDITVQQFNVLRILRGRYPEPATISLLRERMIDKMSDVSRIVERLKQAGLVSRCECEQDRRQVDIRISDAGLALLARIDESSDQLEMNFSSRLSLEEVQQLNALLDKVRG